MMMMRCTVLDLHHQQRMANQSHEEIGVSMIAGDGMTNIVPCSPLTASSFLRFK